jgi:antitoxin PrlF
MTTTIDKAGRVVIPAEVRRRLGLTAGTELEMVIEGFALRLVRAVAGPQLVRRGERLIARPRAAEGQRTDRRSTVDRGGAGPVAGLRGTFFDTSVLIAERSILATARNTPCY